LINEQPEVHGTDPVPLPFQLTIIVISLAVALLTLTAESFWTDELFTRYFIDLDVTLPQAWQRKQ
jgi:multisubunit Na+/H+ antiporter MnhC subunit